MMAISKFTEGITLFLKYQEQCLENDEVRTIITNLYTNRGLAWHQIGNNDSVFSDVDFVLNNIDPKNTKALFRRAHCYKLKCQYQLAVNDLELLLTLDNNQQAKKELKELKVKVEEEKKTKIQEVEVKSTPPPKEPVNEPVSEQKRAQTAQKTKQLDKDIIEKAAMQATEQASNQAMKRVPHTAAGFEKDFNQVKKDQSHIYQFLKNIPYKTIETLFKHSEVLSETFSIALESLVNHGLDS